MADKRSPLPSPEVFRRQKIGFLRCQPVPYLADEDRITDRHLDDLVCRALSVPSDFDVNVLRFRVFGKCPRCEAVTIISHTGRPWAHAAKGVTYTGPDGQVMISRSKPGLYCPGIEEQCLEYTRVELLGLARKEVEKARQKS
jgi:hypothetical protein